MEALYKCCCGMDVHKKLIVACIRNGKDKAVREFGADTSDLNEMADWLVGSGAEMVAMESTASYWKPVYNILEERGLLAIVVNAQHMKNVPGRKTDVKDAEWICDLLMHGLLEPSYIPPRSQRELRETLVYRKSLVCEDTAELNRIQKMLEGANVKLSGTVSSINGKSGRHLLEQILDRGGVSAADIRRMQKEKTVSRNLKASPEELAKALEGFFTEGQKLNLKDAFAHHDYLRQQIETLEERVRASLSDTQKEAVRILSTIPGVSELSAINIIAVTGTDMGQFGTAKRLCSWAGICPGNNESASKKKPAHCTKGNKLLRYTLIQCAASACKAKGTFFKARYDHLVLRRGKNRAKMAVARAILIAAFHMLSAGEEFRDLGEDYYAQMDVEAGKKQIEKKILKLKLSRTEVIKMALAMDFSDCS